MFDQLMDAPLPKTSHPTQHKHHTFHQVIFLSSVGVLRTKQVPFNILNLCGVLDAKRDSEELLKR